MEAYPLKFKPIFKERIWGGRSLAEVFRKKLPPDVKIGESWELADLPQDKSRIINGFLTGKTIAEAIEILGPAITGKLDYSPPLPLLVKILDANDILSVQVHPDEETIARTGKGNPKTECWYIIDTQPGACIYKGLKPGTTRQKFVKAIEDGTCAELLEKVEVEVGQCHLIPAGTLHAIGPGNLIAEIQQPSDTTYRVFDWNRVDDNGKSRQLHIEDALESIHFDSSKDDLSVRSVGRLVDTELFKVDKSTQTPHSELLVSPDIMKVLMILSGSGVIKSLSGETEKFAKGQTLLIPAVYEGTIIFDEYTQFLTITI